MFNPAHKPILYRFLEILPGALVWATLGSAVVISILKPLWGVYFIITFDLYWILRIIYLLIYLNVSWKRFRTSIKIDWLAKLRNDKENYEEYYHAIFLPTLREPFEVLNETFKALQKSNYDTKKFIVILGGEDRDEKNFRENVAILEQLYKDVFFDIIITLHPKGLPGEMPGKGSNSHYMGKLFEKYAEKKGFRDDRIIISNFDSDTQVHREYFSHLTYVYLSQKDPTRHSYQPVAVFNNNIWDSPSTNEDCIQQHDILVIYRSCKT